MSVTKNANGTWRARLGRETKQRTFTLKKDADAYEADLKRARSRAHAGLAEDAGPITYDALADLYLDSYTGKSKAWLTSILMHGRRHFGGRYVRTIRPDDIMAWMNSIDRSPSTKTHILTTFRTVLALGVEWGYLESSPARSRFITVPGRGRLAPIEPFESWAEVEMVAHHAETHYSPLIRFVCATGLRPSEWLELRWSDLDVKGKSCHVRGTKTKAANRVIPLPRLALAALLEMPTPIDNSQRVFTTPKGKLIPLRSWRDGVWKRSLERAGLMPRPPYQMRHTFATLALEQGVPIDSLSKVMGHEGIEITLRYYAKWTRPMLDNTRAILDKIGEENDESTDAVRGQHAERT